jgi:hypothetical protein
MFSRTITAAAALAAAVAVSVAVRRYRSLHRVLARERAAHRLMDGCLHRDLAAFQARIDAAAARQNAERAVLVEAGRAVDDALAVHGSRLNDPNDLQDPYEEGGPV